MSARQEPPELGSAYTGTIDYYRKHGDSEHVLAVEQALTRDWLSTQELARASGKSLNFTRKALEYLGVEGRAERLVEPAARPMFGAWWRYVWRTPSSDGASGG